MIATCTAARRSSKFKSSSCNCRSVARNVALHAVAELIVVAPGLLIFDQRLPIDVPLGQPRERRIELQAHAQPAVGAAEPERIVAHVADVAAEHQV